MLPLGHFQSLTKHRGVPEMGHSCLIWTLCGHGQAILAWGLTPSWSGWHPPRTALWPQALLIQSSCLSLLNRFQAWIAIWRCFGFFFLLNLLFLSLPLSFPSISPNKSFAHLFLLASVSLRPLTNIDSSRNSQRKQVARWGLGSGSLITQWAKRTSSWGICGMWTVLDTVGAPRAKGFTSGE